MTAIEDYHQAPPAQTTNGHRAAPALRWPANTTFSDPQKRKLVAAELKAREELIRPPSEPGRELDAAGLAAEYLADILADAVAELRR